MQCLSEAVVTNNKRLSSTYCTTETNYWQTRSIARHLCCSSSAFISFFVYHPRAYWRAVRRQQLEMMWDNQHVMFTVLNRFPRSCNRRLACSSFLAVYIAYKWRCDNYCRVDACISCLIMFLCAYIVHSWCPVTSEGRRLFVMVKVDVMPCLITDHNLLELEVREKKQ